ncbi:MAG TPA: hypothetical protein PLB01_11315, partial [Thermoanaerobaculia bacterium]|nr:hypothetical protein [Thermoanaerobaculia bacterium]
MPARPPLSSVEPPAIRLRNCSGGSNPTTRPPRSFPSGPRKRIVGTPTTFHASRRAAVPPGGPPDGALPSAPASAHQPSGCRASRR